MATKSMLHRVAQAVTGLSSAVSNTFAEQAVAISEAARAAFGSTCWDIPKLELDTIVSDVREASPWKGSSAEAARESEVRAIVKAYPFLGSACGVFKREYGELRREHVVKVARLCPQSETAQDAGLLAVEFYEARDKKTGSKGGHKATIGMGLGIIKNAQTRKRNEIAFRKELAALCKKHGISY